jgi:UDP-N-acetyl-D-glucosamine dehydrogenase
MELIVVGLGYVGLPLAIHAAKNGYKVFGYDIDEKKIEGLKFGKTPNTDVKSEDVLDLQKSEKLFFCSKIPEFNSPIIVVIAVPTPLGINREPQLEMLISACNMISTFITSNSLIINESTSYIGTLRNLIKPTIDEKSGVTGLKYAVAPERIDPGNSYWNLSNTPRVIGGIDDESSNECVAFYSKICENVITVSSPEVAEAAKLIENSFRLVNLALVNEIAQFAGDLHFSTHEAITAAASKPFGFMPFYPGIGVGGHCIPVDPVYLSFSATSVGKSAKLVDLAAEINFQTPKVIAERVRKYLGGDLIGRKIQIAGIAYKSGTSDTRESPALNLLFELRNFGATVTWFDPLVINHGIEASQALNSDCDLGIIVTPHDQIDFSVWKESGITVLDLSSNSINYGWPKLL